MLKLFLELASLSRDTEGPLTRHEVICRTTAFVVPAFYFLIKSHTFFLFFSILFPDYVSPTYSHLTGGSFYFDPQCSTL